MRLVSYFVSSGIDVFYFSVNSDLYIVDCVLPVMLNSGLVQISFYGLFKYIANCYSYKYVLPFRRYLHIRHVESE